MNVLDFEARLRDTLNQLYMPPEKLPNGERNPDNHPAIRADAMSAVNCMISICRVFRLLDGSDSSNVVPVVADLSFGLQENSFWKQHSATIIPIYKAMLHTKLTAMVMKQNGVPESIYGVMRDAWKILFVIVYDSIYGILKAMGKSMEIMQEVERVL